MDRSFGFMGGLYAISEWIMKFSITNLLWIFFNLPIAFLGVLLLFTEQVESFVFLLILIALLLPILFFPATTAMFGLVREWIIKDENGDQLIQSYWRFYKENYKRSIGNGLVLTTLWTIWAADVYYFMNKQSGMLVLFIIMGALLFVFSINLFSMTVHYEMTFLKSLKSTFLLTIGSPLVFIVITLSSGAVLYASFIVFKFLLPFLTGSLIAYLSFSAFYRHYVTILEKEDTGK